MVGSMSVGINCSSSSSSSIDISASLKLTTAQEDDASLFNSLAFSGTLLLQLGDANINCQRFVIF